jgi:hypothetical protein
MRNFHADATDFVTCNMRSDCPAHFSSEGDMIRTVLRLGATLQTQDMPHHESHCEMTQRWHKVRAMGGFPVLRLSFRWLRGRRKGFSSG